MRVSAVPDWAMGGAALAIGGAVLYLYFRGTKKVASDIATGAVNAASGAITGTINATGGAFQDITQATLGVPKTDQTQCAIDQAAGNTWGASFSCPAGKFIAGLFGSGSSSSAPETTTSPMTAPGGGVIDASTFSSLFTAPNNGSSWNSFNDQAAGVGTLPGVVPQYLPTDWANNYAPANPVPVNAYGATSLNAVAGLRG